MSGIVGVWNLNGQPIERAILARLSATLVHRGLDGEGLWLAGPVGLACQMFHVTPEAVTESQPLSDALGNILVFDGRLDNRDELLAALDKRPEILPGSPDPALVLAAYAAFGERFVERLAGDFAFGLFDGHRRQLLLARDALGVRPLYYGRTGGAFLFASEIKGLLAHPEVCVRPNEDVLAEFLIGGPSQIHHGLTFFEGVAELLPGHIAILTPEKFSVRRYFDFDGKRQLRLASFPDYVGAFREHFENAVRRRLRSRYPVAVSVSGGLDSSSVFCVAQTLRRQAPGQFSSVLGFSHNTADGSLSDERSFLLEIQRAYGVEIAEIPMRHGHLERSREAIWHVEAPYADHNWNTTQTLLRMAHEQGARVLLTGHWGDELLMDFAYLVELFDRLEWGKVRAHLREFPRWFTESDPACFRQMFFQALIRHHLPGPLIPWLRRLRARLGRAPGDRPWYSETFRALARTRRAQQAKIKKDFASAHARSLYQDVRSWIAVFRMGWHNKVAAMYGLETAFPFLDRDLVGFLMSIPGEMETFGGVPKRLLREAMRGILPREIAERRWKADFTHVANTGTEYDFPDVLRILRPDGMVVKCGFVERDKLREELQRLRGPIRDSTARVTWGVLSVLALELWLQLFYGEGHGKRMHTEALEYVHAN